MSADVKCDTARECIQGINNIWAKMALLPAVRYATPNAIQDEFARGYLLVSCE